MRRFTIVVLFMVLVLIATTRQQIDATRTARDAESRSVVASNEQIRERVAPEIRPRAHRGWPLNTFYVPGETETNQCTSDFVTWRACLGPKSGRPVNGQPFCVRGDVTAYGGTGWVIVRTGLPYDNDQQGAYMIVDPDEHPALAQVADRMEWVVACGRYLSVPTFNVSRRLYDVQWVGRL